MSQSEHNTEHTAVAGARIVPLQAHHDHRGFVAEMFRSEWQVGLDPVQWNVVESEPGVLRGVHVHPTHDDYLVLVRGRASIGLRDLRPGSPSENETAVLPLSGDDPMALLIPHGVAHGFYFHEQSVHMYCVSHYWDLDDELSCHWQDPELGIDWPFEAATLSPRDQAAGSLAAMRSELVSRSSST